MRYTVWPSPGKVGTTQRVSRYFSKNLASGSGGCGYPRDLGVVYYKNGRFDDASVYLTRALGIDKDDFNTLLYLGKTSEDLGDMPKALSLYKKLEEKYPNDPEVYYDLAMAYGKANQQGDSHYYFGLYFKKKDKADSALFHLKAALKYFPRVRTGLGTSPGRWNHLRGRKKKHLLQPVRVRFDDRHCFDFKGIGK